MKCPYCNNPAEWVPNKIIYGENIGKSFMIWLCQPCDARIGCHENTQRPLGTMAKRSTRAWRIRAHEAFDSLWKLGHMNRRKAYKELNKWFGVETHIAESNEQRCKQIIDFSNNYIRKLKL